MACIHSLGHIYTAHPTNQYSHQAPARTCSKHMHLSEPSVQCIYCAHPLSGYSMRWWDKMHITHCHDIWKSIHNLQWGHCNRYRYACTLLQLIGYKNRSLVRLILWLNQWNRWRMHEKFIFGEIPNKHHRWIANENSIYVSIKCFIKCHRIELNDVLSRNMSKFGYLFNSSAIAWNINPKRNSCKTAKFQH